MTIKECLAQTKGMPIIGLVVKVKSAYPIETKEFKGKSWKQQNIVLTDATDELKAQVTDPKEDWTLAVGKELTLSAVQTKHGLTGCKIDEYTNNKGLVVKQLKISPTCKIEVNVPNTEEKPLNEVPGTLKPIVASVVPDWNGKEKRELAKTIWDTVFMTVYPKYGETTSEIVITAINTYAQAGLDFVYNQTKSEPTKKDLLIAEIEKLVKDGYKPRADTWKEFTEFDLETMLDEMKKQDLDEKIPDIKF